MVGLPPKSNANSTIFMARMSGSKFFRSQGTGGGCAKTFFIK